MVTRKPSDDEENEGPRFRLSPAWMALAFTMLAGFWQYANTSGRVSENTRRIELLESIDRQRGDTLSQINARTARIEATLEAMNGRPYRPLSEPIQQPSGEQQ